MRVHLPKIGIQATAALVSLMSAISPALADPAIVLGRSICDNQADSFDYDWIRSNVNGTKLFFLSGTTASNGAINAVGHNTPFSAADDIYIAVHGNVNRVDAFSGTEFAALFLLNHSDTPRSVTFYVCESGTAPSNGTSSMASLARSYPGKTERSTSIGAVNAPAPRTCPALAVNATNQPFTPIETLAPAVYRGSPSHTQDHGRLIQVLQRAWRGEDGGPRYPGTEKSYQEYCQDQLSDDPKGAWAPTFTTNVIAQFSKDYLALVNTNYGGSALKTCGPEVQCD